MFDSKNATSAYGLQVAGATSVPVAAVAAAAAYKTQSAKRLKFIRPSQLKDISGETIATKKYDGEQNMVFVEDGKFFTVTAGGTVRTWDINLANFPWKKAVLAAELYYADPSGKRERGYDVSYHARNPKSKESVDNLRLAAFDVVEADGIRPRSAREAWALLQKLPTTGKIHRPEGGLKQASELTTFFETITGAGGEGLVVRADSGDAYKVKTVHTVDLAIIGFACRMDEPDILHDVLLAVARQDGRYQTVCSLGTFSDEIRTSLLAQLRGMIADTEFYQASAEGVAYTMVRPELVLEISCLDALMTRSSGEPINQPVIRFNDSGTWKMVESTPFCTIFSPRFERLREDKSGLVQVDVRASQLEHFGVEEKAAFSEIMPEKTILERRVASKTMKGAEMVRKAYVIKTNREDHGWPRYIVQYTDYSPNRAEPLKRELIGTDDLAQATETFSEYMVELGKSGWQLRQLQKVATTK